MDLMNSVLSYDSVHSFFNFNLYNSLTVKRKDCRYTQMAKMTLHKSKNKLVSGQNNIDCTYPEINFMREKKKPETLTLPFALDKFAQRKNSYCAADCKLYTFDYL